MSQNRTERTEVIEVMPTACLLSLLLYASYQLVNSIRVVKELFEIAFGL